jgi:hypothetical protein
LTGSFILDYCLLVFLGSCGVFQMAAAHAGFQGLVFFRQRLGSFLLGALLLGGAFAWFFLSESRNVPDTAHGMNGNEQFAYFFIGAGAGLAFTLMASSLRNWALGAGGPPPPPGLEALRQSNYIRALNRALRKFRPRPRRPGEPGHRPAVFPPEVSPPRDVDGSIRHKRAPGRTFSRRRAGSETRDLSGEELEEG